MSVFANTLSDFLLILYKIFGDLFIEGCNNLVLLHTDAFILVHSFEYFIVLTLMTITAERQATAMALSRFFLFQSGVFSSHFLFQSISGRMNQYQRFAVGP